MADLSQLEDAPPPKADLSALEDAAPAQAVNPLDALHASVSLSHDIQPEQAARVKAASTSLGLPMHLVAPALDQAEQLVQSRNFDAAKFHATAPGVSGWLASDPHNPAVAKGDLGNLSDTEAAVRNHAWATQTTDAAFLGRDRTGQPDVLTTLEQSAAGFNHQLYRAFSEPFVSLVNGPSEEAQAEYRAGGEGILGNLNVAANGFKNIGMAGSVLANPTGAAGLGAVVGLPAAMQLTGFDQHMHDLAKRVEGENPGFARSLAAGILEESPTLAMMGSGLTESFGPGHPAFEGSRDAAEMFKAHAGQALYDQLGELKDASLTAQRSPDAHQEAVQAAIGERRVYLPYEAVTKALEAKGQDPAEVFKNMGEGKAFQDAVFTGELNLPYSKWLSKADPDVYKAMSKDASFDEAPSVNRAVEDFKSGKAPENAVFENLVNSGMTEERAAPVAALWGGAYRGLGEIAGMSAKDIADKFTPTINAEGEKEGELYQDGNAPAFYSRLAQTIDAKMPESAPVEQVQGIVKDIKPEERKWMGLDEFLKGKKKVSKAELQDYLRVNQLQVKEVTLGGKEQAGVWEKTKNGFRRKIGNRWINLTQTGNDGTIFSGKIIGSATRGISMAFDSMDEAKAHYDESEFYTSNKPTKFHSYTLPGGENYREVMLTLPIEKPSVESVSLYGSNGHWMAKYSNGKEVIMSKPNNEAEAKVEAERIGAAGGGSNNFESPHFDENNVLAHVRLDDRIDAEGKKVLFVEEVQSDWHQKGRKEGYKGDKKITELPSNFEMRVENVDLIGGKTLYKIYNENGLWVAQGFTEEKAKSKAIDKINEASDSPAVPDAPFKKTWHEFAMKRVLRMAAEGGYDKVAWTTGDQQAERYDLSKQIEGIKAEKNDDGTFLISVQEKGKSNFRTVALNAAESDLSEIVGKDLAEKIAAQEVGSSYEDKSKTYSGLDLKVGGEGMKGFYDKIIPDFMRKFGKKYGAEVGESKVKVGSKPVGESGLQNELRMRGYNADADLQEVLASNGGRQPSWMTDEMLSEMEAGEHINNPPRYSSEAQSVHSMPITDAMRKSIMDEGLPLFQGSSKNPLGSFESSRFNINLFESANASTVLHESGHAFLDMVGKLAADEKATPDIKEYWDTIKAHLGIEGEAATREQAETWAKEFEKYLRDGKAPSLKLTEAFGKFRQWLVQVYKNVKAKLGDKVSPELKSTFDKMLSTRDERQGGPVKLRDFNFEPLADDKSTAKEIREQFTGNRNEQIVRGNQLADEIKRIVPDKTMREGMFWYKAAQGDKKVLEAALQHEDLAKYHGQIEAALNLPPEAVQAVDKVSEYYDQAGAAAMKAGTIGTVRENYQNRMYEPEPPQDFVKTETKAGIKQSTSHSKQRVFDTEFEAAQAGKTFATTDVADALAIHNEEMARVNTARQMADYMQKQGLGGWKSPGNTPDGWKQVGTLEKHVPITDKDGNPFVVPMRFMAPEGIADGLKAIADLDYTKRIEALRGIQKWQGLVKTVDLSLSFFHHLSMLAQSVYQRDMTTMLNLKDMSKFLDHPDFRASEQDFALHGGITSKVEANQDILRDLAKQEGWATLPGVKQYLKLIDTNSNFLFGKLQRFLKTSNYANEAAAWIGKHPEATNEEVLAAKRGIAKNVNSVFGGLNWENMGMTKSNLSLLRLVLLAPDWTISNVQLLKQAIGEKGTAGNLSRAHIASALIVGMAATEGLNKLLTGHFTDKNKPGHKLEVEIRPDVYVSLLRGGIGDISKFASMTTESGLGGAARFAQGKLAPFPRTVIGLASNTQYTGRPVVRRNPGPVTGTYDVLKYAAQNAAPMPIGASSLSDYLHRGTKPDAIGAAAVAAGVARFSKK